ncbi:hypothetical protein E2C01_019672 [Portunus trituberculatus]|uniref:Uncharacterized protein n=1 Tax=Portunus trituberculatus TaxID=210409 RepID=A0A5B7DZH0_PORTR|nr:hypothetical protein [Portunus trituberculatus]
MIFHEASERCYATYMFHRRTCHGTTGTPTHAALTHRTTHTPYLHLPTFALMNGSVSVIGEGHNGFTYCIANLRLPCRVNWTVPDDTHF